MSFSNDTYNTTVTELKAIDKAIRNDIKEFKINANTNVNTSSIEKSINKNMENYFNKVKKLTEEYDNTETQYKKNLSDFEFSKRKNQIQQFYDDYDKNKNIYNDILDKGNPDDDKYKINMEDEKYKNMSNKQLFDNSKKALKDQDSQIVEIIGETRKGKELGRELKDELIKQNIQLEGLEKDVDKLQSKMQRVRKKFDNYIENSSTCLITSLIILQLISLTCLIIFWN